MKTRGITGIGCPAVLYSLMSHQGVEEFISLFNIFGCPAALYSLMSHVEVEVVGQKIYQLYMPSYQNRSCSVCLQDVYLTFLDSTTNNTNNYSRAAKEPALVKLISCILYHHPSKKLYQVSHHCHYGRFFLLSVTNTSSCHPPNNNHSTLFNVSTV